MHHSHRPRLPHHARTLYPLIPYGRGRVHRRFFVVAARKEGSTHPPTHSTSCRLYLYLFLSFYCLSFLSMPPPPPVTNVSPPRPRVLPLLLFNFPDFPSLSPCFLHPLFFSVPVSRPAFFSPLRLRLPLYRYLYYVRPGPHEQNTRHERVHAHTYLNLHVTAHEKRNPLHHFHVILLTCPTKLADR